MKTAVSNYEQDLQSTLQSAITYLRTNQRDKRTKWSTASKCHRYTLQLVDNTPAGASPSAIGFLTAGSQFFAKAGETQREIKNRHAVDDVPPVPFPADTDYPPTATALPMKGGDGVANCAPCDSDSDSIAENDHVFESSSATEEAPAPTTPPDASVPIAELKKRQASSCTVRPTTAPLPTSSAEASAIAANSESAAKAAAAAAAAALASAPNPAPDLAAAAAAAIAAANALVPAAAALVCSFLLVLFINAQLTLVNAGGCWNRFRASFCDCIFAVRGLDRPERPR